MNGFPKTLFRVFLLHRKLAENSLSLSPKIQIYVFHVICLLTRKFFFVSFLVSRLFSPRKTRRRKKSNDLNRFTAIHAALIMRRISRHCWTKKFHLYRIFRAKINRGKDISKDNKHERRPGTDGLVRVLFFTRVRHATTFKFGKFHFDAEISSTLRPKLVLLELWLSQSWNSTISARLKWKTCAMKKKQWTEFANIWLAKQKRGKLIFSSSSFCCRKVLPPTTLCYVLASILLVSVLFTSENVINKKFLLLF